MTLIRSTRVPDNQGGRGGCQVMSPYTGAIYYVTVEHGRLVLRDYGKAERATDGPVTLADPKVSAAFANSRELCVTVAGFPPDTSESGLDTYLFEVQE